MSINHQMFLAFAAEMAKTAGAMGTVGNWVRQGWSGGGAGPNRLGKALTVLPAALAMPGALKKEDPTGQGRSRVERLGDVAGQTVGGLAGFGAGQALVNKWGLQPAGGAGMNLASRAGRSLGRAGVGMGVGMGASILGQKLFTAPSRMLRKQRLENQRKAQGMQPPNEQQMSPQPQSPIAQEGQQGQMR
jgi:hypothetical protein